MPPHCLLSFRVNPTPPPDIYTLSLHDALPIYQRLVGVRRVDGECGAVREVHRHRPDVDPEAGHLRPEPQHDPLVRLDPDRSEEHTSELQSLRHLVCRLLLEKKKNNREELPMIY